jgi:hypothetical protein
MKDPVVIWSFSSESEDPGYIRRGTGVPWHRFSLRILWSSQSGNHPENDLAKFDQILIWK